MPVHAEHLLTFAAVARSGSLSAAAEELHLSQPSVSAQLKLLTSAVGEPLFTRHRYGVRLTPTGEALLPHAQGVWRALDGARHFVREVQGLGAGAVRVAASNTLAAHVLPRVLATFRAQHSSVRLDVQTGNTREALRRLLAGDCDLALVEGPLTPVQSGLRAQILGHDRLCLVFAPHHPLARAHLDLSDLQGLPVVWREVGSGTREVAEQALLRADITVTSVLELAGTEAVKEAVLSGLGAAFLSELSVRREREAGQLVSPDLSLPGLSRPLTALTPEVPSRAAAALLAELLGVLSPS